MTLVQLLILLILLFHGVCAPVSFYHSSQSPEEMLDDEAIQQITELSDYIDCIHFAYHPIHIFSIQKGSKGTEFAVSHYGGATPLDPSSRQMILKHIDTTIQKLCFNIHLLGQSLSGVIEC